MRRKGVNKHFQPEEHRVRGQDQRVTPDCPSDPGGPGLFTAHQTEVTQLTGALHRGQLVIEIGLVSLTVSRRPGQEDISVDPEIHDDE